MLFVFHSNGIGGQTVTTPSVSRNTQASDRGDSLQLPAKVWVNRSSGVYHCPGTRYYGATKRGEFMSEPQARQSGNRPAYGRACGMEGEAVAPALADLQMRHAANSQDRPGSSDTKVWVNQASHVYHCQGTRYYGSTKRGRFMSEGEAIESGNRPAYGRSCG